MLKLWELAASPNSTKVRMALRFKGIEFETIPVDPTDRTAIVRVIGQELTPAIEDKGIVLNDSEAILQYLDANYPKSPRLFPVDRAGRRLCENWRKELDEKVAKYWMPVFFHVIGQGDLDSSALKSYQDSLGWLDELIGDKDQFKEGEDLTICDLRVAEWATYAIPSDGFIERCPIFGKFKEIFGVNAGSYKNLERFLKPWNQFLE